MVGTTVMLWLGCSNYTWDPGTRAEADYSVLENYPMQEDSLLNETAGAMDELDE